MELRPCPLVCRTEGLQSVNHQLGIEFAHTSYHDLEPKLDAIMASKDFEKVDTAQYRREDGREVMICRLGATIKAVWIEKTKTTEEPHE